MPQAGDPLAHGRDAPLEPRGDGGRGVAAGGQLAQAVDQAQELGDGGRLVHEIHAQAQPLDLVEGLLAVPRPRRHHEVGPQADERLEVRRQHVAHAGLSPGLGRVVAEIGDAHEGVLCADGEQDLGHARHQRDDAPGRGRKSDLVTRRVDDGQRLRDPGQQAERECEDSAERGHKERSVTPADLKVAISPSIFVAALARPMQSAEPVPSPRRILRSR